ncbi:MAG: DUF4124 domain-containing protein [Burkholderiales bacterium]|nr:DUF4124 domain-containing protein [Burkholderiales bacterium]MDQ3197191.1 DUF4124 domain-containing protein [Pseudomonadota bacterium]
MKGNYLYFLIATAAVGALAAGSAAAETCKYEDASGKVTYSNVAIKGAKKIQCFEPPAAPPAGAARQAKVAPSDANVPGLPNVDSDTQKRRDEARRKILESELVLEQKLLAESQQALTEGEAVRLGNEKNYQKYLDRIQELKDNVGLHEKNVAALKQEIANIK